MKANRSGFGILILMLALTTGCHIQENTVPVQTETPIQVQTEETHAEELHTEETVGPAEETKAEETAETVKEQSDAGERIQSIDVHKMVAEAIITQSQVMYPGYECAAEGHIILDTVTEDGILTVYAQTMYGEYQFHNGDYFVKSAGSGVIPCVMEFLVNEQGGYKLYAVQWPEDGSRYVQSIQEMFPEALWDTCISPSEDVKEELTRQEQAYAGEYLKQLGREAKIGDYADFTYTLLTEQGVSVQASNALLEWEKDLGDYPNWVGTHELIEDGVRYVYGKEVDEQAGVIRLTKAEYQSGRIVEFCEYDWQTGAPVTGQMTAQGPFSAGSHDVLLTQAPVLKLQDMLSGTYKPFEIQSGNFEWSYPQGDQMVSVVACGADPREYVKDTAALEIPGYNRMDQVGYSVFCEKEPSSLVVKEYYRAALEDGTKEPVDVQNYDQTFIIRLKPNRYYEIYAVWEEADMEINGFYGRAEYVLVTDV